MVNFPGELMGARRGGRQPRQMHIRDAGSAPMGGGIWGFSLSAWAVMPGCHLPRCICPATVTEWQACGQAAVFWYRPFNISGLDETDQP